MANDGTTLPKSKELNEPIMRILAGGDEKLVDDIVDGVIAILGLKPEVTRLESHIKGESKIKYAVKWNLTNLSNNGFLTITKRGYRQITEKGKRALAEGYDWSAVPVIKTDSLHSNGAPESDFTDVQPVKSPMTKGSTSFFDELRRHNLAYETRVVEDFLLSLKAKQFLVLSGGSGTGKTKLALEYGKFVSSEIQPNLTEVTFSVKLGKSDESGGYTLNADRFFEAFPDYQKPDGQYRFSLGGTDGLCRIQMMPRLWYRGCDGDKEISETITRLKEHQDKADLKLIVDRNQGHTSSGSNYAIIPVGSNWTDSRSIIGYKNVLTGKYCRTPALDLIIEAESDESNPKLLILDEMNLSHVEWYFSDLLSSMESGEPIEIESDGTIPGSIRTGDNLFVIGTVNMDETTYSFSPKVLDRANVIEFQPVPVSTLLDGDGSLEEPHGDVQFLQNCMAGIGVRSKGAAELIEDMSSAPGNTDIVRSMIGDIDALQKLMSSIGLPFGFRTVDEVMRFMTVAWEYEGKGEFSNWKRYLDSQIMQKILPKVHGNASIRRCLEDMKAFCAGNGYPRSSDKLDRMLKILESQRYVSFNS